MNHNREILLEMDENYLIADGFDNAIIGIHGEKVVYSTNKCIEILMKEHEMSDEDAFDHFNFNVSGAYVGEKTPIFVDDLMF